MNTSPQNTAATITALALRAANDNDRKSRTNYRYRGGARLITWLAKRDPDAALAVWRYSKLETRHGIHDNRQHNAIPADSDDAEPRGAVLDKYAVERLHEIRPTIDHIMSEIYRPRVVTQRADGVWSRVHGHMEIFSDNPSHHGRILADENGWPFTIVHKPRLGRVMQIGMRIGDLVFNTNPERRERGGAEGLITQYALTKNRVAIAPKVLAVKSRGGKSAKRSDATIASYLRLRGVPFEQRQAKTRPIGSGPDISDYQKTDDQKAAEKELEKWRDRIDLFPATLCPPAIAEGAHWLGGVKKPKPTATYPAPVWQTDADIPDLSEKEQAILEEAIAGATFTDIGKKQGAGEHYAKRAGKSAFLATAAALMAANDNNLKKHAAA